MKIFNLFSLWRSGKGIKKANTLENMYMNAHSTTEHILNEGKVEKDLSPSFFKYISKYADNSILISFHYE